MITNQYTNEMSISSQHNSYYSPILIEILITIGKINFVCVLELQNIIANANNNANMNSNTNHCSSNSSCPVNNLRSMTDINENNMNMTGIKSIQLQRRQQVHVM